MTVTEYLIWRVTRCRVPRGKDKNHCSVQKLAEFSIPVPYFLQHCFAVIRYSYKPT